jgi:hypothetical protein
MKLRALILFAFGMAVLSSCQKTYSPGDIGRGTTTGRIGNQVPS